MSFFLDRSTTNIIKREAISPQFAGNVSQQYGTGTPSQSPIEQAFTKTNVADKCQALTQALNSANLKELQAHFHPVVQKIFGFQSYAPGWLIEQMNKNQRRREYDAVQNLLSPDGPLFTVISKLLEERSVFEFPLSLLPDATRRKIEDGTLMSELYINKINLTTAAVMLNAYEYYMFVFAHRIVDSTTKTQALYLDPAEWCYPNLLNLYLSHFLPLDGMPPTLPCKTTATSPSAVTSPHRTYSNPQSHMKKSGLGLLRHTPTLQRTISVQNPHLDSIDGDVMWRSEKLVQILMEFWMNQTSVDYSSAPATATFDRSAHSDAHQRRMGIFAYLYRREFLPSHDLIMIVRMLIKHIHAFTNTSQGNILPSSQQNPSTTLGALKRLLPSLLQRPLYGFLKHAFDKWPLDTSYRPILETWLTFIRPWRYSDLNESIPNSGDQDQPVNLNIWRTFVRDHSLFYTNLLQQVIKHFVRVDMKSSKMAFQFSRVTKVFNTPGLADILREVEDCLRSQAYGFPEYGYGDSTGNASGIQAAFLSQFNEVEALGFTYKFIFSGETLNQVYHLMQQMIQTHTSIQQLLKQRQSQISQNGEGDKSLLRMLGLGDLLDLNTSQVNNETLDEKNTEKWLSLCIADLAEIFKLEVPEINRTETLTPDHGDSNLPDHVITTKGIQLTDRGRYEVINGLKRFNIEYSGDPELHPIRSYENATLVRWLYGLSCSLNRKYGELFKQWYDRDDFFGLMARRYLSLPDVKQKFSGILYSPPSQSGGIHVHHGPRVSLRALASYQVHFYGSLLYIVLWALFGKVPSLFFIVLFVFLYGILGAMNDKIRGKGKVKDC